MGRPLGSKNRAGRAEIERLRARSAAVWAVIDQRLSEHCTKTALWLAGRLLPDSRVVELDPTPDEIADALAAADITVGEAQRAAAAIKALSDAEELRHLRERLDALETLLAARADPRTCRS